MKLETIDNEVQLSLRNIVGTPFGTSTRISAYNRVIDFLQSKANWNSTRRVNEFEYLSGETDYSIENNLKITDFKQPWDLRFIEDNQVSNISEFEEIDSKKFTIKKGQRLLGNFYTIEDRDNDKILRIISNFNRGSEVVHEMDSLTTNGTWASDTTSSDATTLSVDETRAKTGSGSFKFNIDVSQSTNDYARIYTSTDLTTGIDASDYEGIGSLRFWLDLKSFSATQLGYITNIELRWGTDSSNYWSQTTDTNITGGDFASAWNRLNFNWGDATKVGSPDSSDMVYYDIRINYSSSMTDVSNVRVDQIKIFDPQDMEWVYFSNSFVSKAGVWQKHFSTTVDNTEVLLLPDQHLNLFINLALQILFPQKERSNDDYIRVKSEIKEELPLAIMESGNSITREKYEFMVAGYSSGRSDVGRSQW